MVKHKWNIECIDIIYIELYSPYALFDYSKT